MTKTKSGPKTLVLGLGDVLLGDEGVGVHVVRALERRDLALNVEYLAGGTGSLILTQVMRDAARMVMIDATADGNPIGTVTRTAIRFARDYPPTLTAHDRGIKDLLDLFYRLHGAREVVLYAITIDPPQPMTTDLSAVANRAAKEAVEKIVAELTFPLEQELAALEQPLQEQLD